MILMKDIIDDTNPLLREKSELVDLPLKQEDRDLLMSMYEYLKNSQNEEMIEKYELRAGVGIAAVQLGILKRMFALLIYDYDEENNIIGVNTSYALVNPKIISHSIKKVYLKDGEGCLSVNENYDGYVPRYNKVTVQGYDAITNQSVTIVARGYLSIVLQHELDHFDGKLFYDYIDPNDPYKPIEDAIEL